jgi:hypothetical protein
MLLGPCIAGPLMPSTQTGTSAQSRLVVRIDSEKVSESVQIISRTPGEYIKANA